MDIAQLRTAVQLLPGLELLVLHGSRARGDAHADSDWDFAYIADASLDLETLREVLVKELNAAVDVANLNRAGGVLRQRVAKDGVVVFDKTGRCFEQFQLRAIGFWLEALPVLRQSFDAEMSEILQR